MTTDSPSQTDPWIGTPEWLREELRAARVAVRGEYATPAGYAPLIEPDGLARVLAHLYDVVQDEPVLVDELTAFVAELYASRWLTPDNDAEVRAAMRVDLSI